MLGADARRDLTPPRPSTHSSSTTLPACQRTFDAFSQYSRSEVMSTRTRSVVLDRIDTRSRAFAATRWGHMLLLLAAALGWVVLWAWFDVMVVRLAFPPPLNPASSTPTYWAATWGFLFPLATLFAFREHAWLPYLAVIAGAWEDVLFYWIQWEPVPGSVAPWFYGRAAAFLLLAIVGEVASHRLPVRHRIVALVALAVAGAFFNLEWLALTLAAILIYLALTEFARLLHASVGAWKPPPSRPKAP